MRIFGDPERTKRLLSRAGMQQGEAIESKLLSRQIERAQRKVEAHNFDIRKQLLEYDDVSNDQRKVVYEQRTDLMGADDIEDVIGGVREEVVNLAIDEYIQPQSAEETWDIAGLTKGLEHEFGTRVDVEKFLEKNDAANEVDLREELVGWVSADYEAKVAEHGAELMRELERGMMLRQLDTHWKDHIGALDYLRQWIHLRAYAQRKPAQEYKREAFEMFSQMLDRVKYDTIVFLSKVQIRRPEDAQALGSGAAQTGTMRFQHAAAPSLAAASPELPHGAGKSPSLGPISPAGGTSHPQSLPRKPVTPYIRQQPKIGRNDPCPCKSGKKYKHCHGRLS